MKDEEEIYTKEKLTEEEKIAGLKEIAFFALVAFLLFALHLVLPDVLRFIVRIIH